MTAPSSLWALPFDAPAGEVLFTPGAPCPGLVILDAGEIRVTLTGESGRELVLYRVIPGQICLQTFACLAQSKTYSATGTAVSDLSGTLVPPHLFERRMGEDPGFRALVLRAVSERFTQYERLVEDVVLTGLGARLARVLMRLQNANGVVHMTHEALAAETGSGRAVISRRLAEFERQGIIRRDRTAIQILDPQKMQMLGD